MRMLIKGSELRDFLTKYESLALIKTIISSQIEIDLYLYNKKFSSYHLDIVKIDWMYNPPLLASKNAVPRIFGEFVDTDFMYSILRTLKNKNIVEKIVNEFPMQKLLVNGLKNIEIFKSFHKNQIKTFAFNQNQFI